MKVINFFGGPCSGKSTMSAALFAEMKNCKIRCELVTEFAKDLVWEKQYTALNNQIYVLGCQLQRIFRLKDSVDYVITDSPILLSSLYFKKSNSTLYKDFHRLVVAIFNEYDNINIFLNRVKQYSEYGRLQTEKQAKEIDNKILLMLKHEKLKYIECKGDLTQIPYIYSTINYKQ